MTARTPFLFLAISTVLNIGLDLLCIIVFKWGVAGAAIATIAAQAVSGIFVPHLYPLPRTAPHAFPRRLQGGCRIHP